MLCQTLAALYSHASLAITSVAEPGVDLALASRGVSPTVIISSAETLRSLHDAETAGISNALQKFAHVSQSQAMSAGRMPTDTLLFRLFGPRGGAAGTTPGKLRLILVSQRLEAGSPILSSTMLSDLRIFTRARICYALGADKVAGAVAQTNLYDYRSNDRPRFGHFGPPVSSVEVKLLAKDDKQVDGNSPSGALHVAGPAVAEGQATTGISMAFAEDCTLRYA